VSALALLLLVLGVTLSVVLGRVVFDTDYQAFYDEARSAVATSQHTFDSQVRGRAQNVTCAGVPSYQDAFEESVAKPLIASQAGIQSVYLLSTSGDILAPTTPDSQLFTRAPYLSAQPIYQLANQLTAAAKTAGTGYVTDVHYLMSDAHGQHLGVELVLDRFYTASHCVAPTAHIETGIVEVVTTFPRYQTIMARVRLLFLIAFGLVLIVGLLIGVPLTATALRPLSRMTETAQRIARGDLSQRVRLSQSGDEIGQLGATFDEMIDRIDRAFAAQRASEERMRQFIADASHELRTPLTAIRGGIEVLQRGAKHDPDMLDQVLRTTQRESERMTRLLGDLLTLARLDAGRPLERQPLDLVRLAGEAVDQARLVAGERQVTLETDHRGRLLVLADSDRLKQVLLVLVDNALKYGRQGPDGWVRISVLRAGSTATVRVLDNGQGIPPDDLPHIFDRFYRAERAARRRRLTGPQKAITPADVAAQAPRPSGSGLGLAIARAIIHAHGGTISVQSQPGVGTTFTLTLPYDAGTTLPPTTLPPVGQPPSV
jgi:signal transduction histidine kinase